MVTEQRLAYRWFDGDLSQQQQWISDFLSIPPPGSSDPMFAITALPKILLLGGGSDKKHDIVIMFVCLFSFSFPFCFL